MLLSQDGKCLICKKEKNKLCVDHNHDTGKIRGLLCVKCNSNLGWHECYLKEINKYLNKENGKSVN